MLYTSGDIITEVLVRNNRTTTDSFITDAMLQDWLRQSHVWASSYKKWPMTQARAETTFSTEETPYFEGWKANSTRFIQVGGKRYQKINFEDYKIFREEQPNSQERVFSDFARVYYINPNSTSGSVVAYGQYEPNIDPTDLNTTTIFSGYDEEGNEALVEKMTAFLKRREQQLKEAELYDQRASVKLEEVWERIKDEGFAYHSNDRGMFKRLDILTGRPIEEEIKRNQF